RRMRIRFVSFLHFVSFSGGPPPPPRNETKRKRNRPPPRRVNGYNDPTMIRVNLGPRSYDIAVVSGDPDGLGPFARPRCPAARAFVVADENVMAHAEAAARSLHAAGFTPALVTVSPGEATKCLAVVARLYDALADLPADRQTPVVAVGGGVVGDLAG